MTDVVQKLWGFCHTLRHDGIDGTRSLLRPENSPLKIDATVPQRQPVPFPEEAQVSLAIRLKCWFADDN